MFEFIKLCRTLEKSTAAQREKFLSENVEKVLNEISAVFPQEDEDGVKQKLACLLLGSVTTNGKINERDYIVIYPALVKIFGPQFDFSAAKARTETLFSAKSAEKNKLRDFAGKFNDDGDSLRDVVSLCLAVVSADGKLSFRAKNYFGKLCLFQRL